MFQFLWDFIIYPFDSHKENNKFSRFLMVAFKQYPALLWIKPNFKKIIGLPFILLYYVFRTKKKEG